MQTKSLKFRIILVVTAMVLACGASVAGIAAYHFSTSLEKEVRARAQGIARRLALQAADLVLINDRISIQRLLGNEIRGNRDIAYIFLQRDGEILGHTFEAGVPQQLLDQSFRAPDGESAIRSVVSETGQGFFDISQPVFRGKAGLLRLGVKKASYLDQINSLWYEMVLFTFLVLAVSISICLFFAKQIARPLENLVQAIKGMSGGHLSARLQPAGGLGEVDVLTVSFNAMADRIATYTGKLQEQAADLEHAQQQARLSCSIIQEVSALSTPKEIGEHLAYRLRQILRCRDTLLLLKTSQNDILFQIGRGGVTQRNLKETPIKLFTDLEQKLEKRYVLPAQPEAAALVKEIGPFERVGIVPVHKQRQFLGALITICHDKKGCQECENSLAETVLQQASGTIMRALKHEEELHQPHSGKPDANDFHGLVGRSPKMTGLYRLIRDVAPTDSTVLLMGESGTGKEVVARAIHQESPRADKAFVVIDCSAYPATLLESEVFGHEKGAFTGAMRRKPGRFELAQGGTVFLDEIGEIPLSAQVKLLRVLQTQQIERLGGEETLDLDVRILAASNKDLLELVKNGSFREDLFYRLNVFPINLPPLRTRLNDVPLLARHFLSKFNEDHGKELAEFSDEAMRIMLDYHWPGNVRELENLVERAVILAKGSEILPWDLPADLRQEVQPASASLSLSNQEKAALAVALEQCAWNKKEAAKRLGISRTTLYRKIKKHNLSEPTQH